MVGAIFHAVVCLGKDLRMDDTKRQDNLKKAIVPLGIKLENLSYRLHGQIFNLLMNWETISCNTLKNVHGFNTHQQVLFLHTFWILLQKGIM